MGKESFHRVDAEYQIRTAFTPNQGWQGWPMKDGRELCSIKRRNSRAAALVWCQKWIKENKQQTSAA